MRGPGSEARSMLGQRPGQVNAQSVRIRSGHCEGCGFDSNSNGNMLEGLRRKMMKPDSVLKRPLCPVDRKLTMVEARMELGDQGRRLLGSPRRKLVVTSAQVWAMDGERAWHLEHSPPRTCWPIQCGGHQISPKLACHIGTQSQVDTLTGV